MKYELSASSFYKKNCEDHSPTRYNHGYEIIWWIRNTAYVCACLHTQFLLLKFTKVPEWIMEISLNVKKKTCGYHPRVITMHGYSVFGGLGIRLRTQSLLLKFIIVLKYVNYGDFLIKLMKMLGESKSFSMAVRVMLFYSSTWEHFWQPVATSGRCSTRKLFAHATLSARSSLTRKGAWSACSINRKSRLQSVFSHHRAWYQQLYQTFHAVCKLVTIVCMCTISLPREGFQLIPSQKGWTSICVFNWPIV